MSEHNGICTPVLVVWSENWHELPGSDRKASQEGLVCLFVIKWLSHRCGGLVSLQLIGLRRSKQFFLRRKEASRSTFRTRRVPIRDTQILKLSKSKFWKKKILNSAIFFSTTACLVHEHRHSAQLGWWLPS